MGYDSVPKAKDLVAKYDEAESATTSHTTEVKDQRRSIAIDVARAGNGSVASRIDDDDSMSIVSLDLTSPSEDRTLSSRRRVDVYATEPDFGGKLRCEA